MNNSLESLTPFSSVPTPEALLAPGENPGQRAAVERLLRGLSLETSVPEEVARGICSALDLPCNPLNPQASLPMLTVLAKVLAAERPQTMLDLLSGLVRHPDQNLANCVLGQLHLLLTPAEYGLVQSEYTWA